MKHREFRLFISSTFRGFNNTRNAMIKYLYNPIIEYCAKNNATFHPIDLRWGIDSGKETVSGICLQEIKHCKETNLVPNFLIMLGDYYGARIVPEIITETEWNDLLSFIERIDMDNCKKKFWDYIGDHGENILEEQLNNDDWTDLISKIEEINVENVQLRLLDLFKLDVNSEYSQYTQIQKPLEYQSRSDFWDVYLQFFQKFLCISALYLISISYKDWDLNKAKKFFQSVTEYEIEYGLFKEEKGRESIFALFNQQQNLKTLGFFDYNELLLCHDYNILLNIILDDSKCLMLLKNRIKEVLPEENLIEINYSDSELENNEIKKFPLKFIDFLNQIENNYLKILEKQFIQKDVDEEEQKQQALFANELLNFYVETKQQIKLKNSIQSESGKILLITGESGVGKTAFIANITSSTQNNIRYFCGATANSQSILHILCYIMEDLNAICELEKYNQITLTYENGISIFERALITFSEKYNKDVKIFIDGWENIYDIKQLQGGLLSIFIPSNILLVISAINKPDALYPINELSLKKMNKLDAMKIVEEYLKYSKRKLTENQWKFIHKSINEYAAPIYVSLLSKQAAAWPSYFEPDQVYGENNGTSNLIIQYFDYLIKVKYYKSILIKKFLGYIFISRYGLSELELLELFKNDEEILINIANSFQDSDEKSKINYYKQYGVPHIYLAQLKYELRDYLSNVNQNNTILMRFFHSIVKETTKRYLSQSIPYVDIDLLREKIINYFEKGENYEKLSKNEEGYNYDIFNRRKAEELLYHIYPIYKQEYKKNFCHLESIYDKLSDITFCDIMVKSRLINELTEYILLIFNNIIIDNKADNYILNLIIILREYSEQFSMFPNTFLNICASFGDIFLQHINILDIKIPYLKSKIESTDIDLYINNSNKPFIPEYGSIIISQNLVNDKISFSSTDNYYFLAFNNTIKIYDKITFLPKLHDFIFEDDNKINNIIKYKMDSILIHCINGIYLCEIKNEVINVNKVKLPIEEKIISVSINNLGKLIVITERLEIIVFSVFLNIAIIFRGSIIEHNNDNPPKILWYNEDRFIIISTNTLTNIYFFDIKSNQVKKQRFNKIIYNAIYLGNDIFITYSDTTINYYLCKEEKFILSKKYHSYYPNCYSFLTYLGDKYFAFIIDKERIDIFDSYNGLLVNQYNISDLNKIWIDNDWLFVYKKNSRIKAVRIYQKKEFINYFLPNMKLNLFDSIRSLIQSDNSKLKQIFSQIIILISKIKDVNVKFGILSDELKYAAIWYSVNRKINIIDIYKQKILCSFKTPFIFEYLFIKNKMFFIKNFFFFTNLNVLLILELVKFKSKKITFKKDIVYINKNEDCLDIWFDDDTYFTIDLKGFEINNITNNYFVSRKIDIIIYNREQLNEEIENAIDSINVFLVFEITNTICMKNRGEPPLILLDNGLLLYCNHNVLKIYDIRNDINHIKKFSYICSEYEQFNILDSIKIFDYTLYTDYYQHLIRLSKSFVKFITQDFLMVFFGEQRSIHLIDIKRKTITFSRIILEPLIDISIQKGAVVILCPTKPYYRIYYLNIFSEDKIDEDKLNTPQKISSEYRYLSKYPIKPIVSGLVLSLALITVFNPHNFYKAVFKDYNALSNVTHETQNELSTRGEHEPADVALKSISEYQEPIMMSVPVGFTPIYTVEDLDSIRSNLDGKFILMKSLDLSAIENWEPIGIDDESCFTGEFYGNGLAIQNMHTYNHTYSGLFGCVANCTIKDLAIINATISVDGSLLPGRDLSTGGIAGKAIAVEESSPLEIINCSFHGRIYATTTQKSGIVNIYAGGLIGELSGKYSKASIIIEKCSNYGNVATLFVFQNETTSNPRVCSGGIVGYSYLSSSLSFNSCINEGEISSYGNFLSFSDSSRCSSGGMIGNMSSSSSSHTTAEYIQCENYGKVSAESGWAYAGGLFGYFAARENTNIVFRGLYNNACVTASGEYVTSAGGLAGTCTGNIKIDNSTNSGIINVNSLGDVQNKHAGGLLGEASSGTMELTKCCNNGSVNSRADAGGIIGEAKGNIHISQTYNQGSIFSKGSDVGGIVAYAYTKGYLCVVDCYNAGKLESNSYVGGIIGNSSAFGMISVINCYNSGLIACSENEQKKASGILNYNQLEKSQYHNYSYSSNGQYYEYTPKNIYSDLLLELEIENCYYVDNIEKGLSELEEQYSVICLSPTRMKSSEEFIGFDFNNIWEMGDNDYFYPIIRFQNEKNSNISEMNALDEKIISNINTIGTEGSSLKYEMKKEYFEHYNSTGILMDTNTIEYPYFTGESVTDIFLNAKFKDLISEYKNNNINYDEYYKNLSMGQEKMLPFYSDVEVVVTFNDYGFISLIEKFSEWSGSVYPLNYVTGITVSLEDSSELTYSDIIKGNDEQILNILNNYSKQSLGYTVDLTKDVEFSFVEEGLCFYYFSGGAVPLEKIIIPYTDLDSCIISAEYLLEGKFTSSQKEAYNIVKKYWIGLGNSMPENIECSLETDGYSFWGYYMNTGGGHAVTQFRYTVDPRTGKIYDEVKDVIVRD